MTSKESSPVVCTLTAADLGDREGAWEKLLGSGLVDRNRVPGGVRLHSEAGATASLLALIELERECCAWIDFEIAHDAATGEANVVLTAESEGEAVLAGMFFPQP
jgi:hypothetical protein